MFALSSLLDKRDLQKKPAELGGICEKMFRKGKGIRSRLTALTGSFLKLKPAESLLLSRVVEYIHNSSLLHDDFIDQSLRRRSLKAAWFEFSPAQAVLAGDYLLAKVNIYLAREGNMALIQKTAETVCRLAEGEFLQKELIDTQNKDAKKRDRVSELKTGSLFQWSLQAPFIYKKRSDKKLLQLLTQTGCDLGRLFQRADDLMDFSVRNKDKKACFCDLKQSYFNSFACFLLKNTTGEKAQSLKKARSLRAIYRNFPKLDEKIKAFDRLNTRLINKTENNLKNLRPFLKREETGLISALREWPYFLYWRKKRP